MMLMATLNTLKPQLRFNPSKPNIENFVFKLHYRATVVFLLACVFLVCAREYFGEHIRCIADQGVPEHVIKTYCFFMATFTIVRHYNESLLETGFIPHPGVGPLLASDEVLHHTYYQWVPFLLFVQSICFYIPHYIWKKQEGGRVKALVDGLQFASLSLDDVDLVVNGKAMPSRSTIDRKIAKVKLDIITRLRISRTWSLWLVAMEVANLVNIILQIYYTNMFLNGHFIGLGARIFDTNWDQIADPLESVFPKVTKCIFHKYGPSGSIQQHDALCVMALNIIHEKIYTILWFWFLFLFIASVLAVIWRIITFFYYRRTRFNEVIMRQISSGNFTPETIVMVVNGCKFADWLFLHYLAKNMQGFIFQRLFAQLAEDMTKERTLSVPEEKPQLVDVIDYNDETLPLNPDEEKKVS